LTPFWIFIHWKSFEIFNVDIIFICNPLNFIAMRDFMSLLGGGVVVFVVIAAIVHDLNVEKGTSSRTSNYNYSTTSHYGNQVDYTPAGTQTTTPANFFQSNDNSENYRSSTNASSYPSSSTQSQALQELEYYNEKLNRDLERDEQYWKLQNELNQLKRESEIFDEMKEESRRQEISRSIDNMYFEMQKSSNDYGSYGTPDYSTSDYSGGGSGDVYVRGYYRKNGTYVQPHYRTAPNSTTSDNYGSRRGRY
jgi:hypothetical protein